MAVRSLMCRKVFNHRLEFLLCLILSRRPRRVALYITWHSKYRFYCEDEINIDFQRRSKISGRAKFARVNEYQGVEPPTPVTNCVDASRRPEMVLICLIHIGLIKSIQYHAAWRLVACRDVKTRAYGRKSVVVGWRERWVNDVRVEDFDVQSMQNGGILSGFLY